MLTKPKAILFDWDNTLVDTWPIIMFALNTMFEQMNRPTYSEEQMRREIHKSARDSLPKLFGDDWQKAEQIYQTTYLKHRYEKLTLLPQAREMLDLLKADGTIYMSIVSNKTGQTLREEISYLKLDDYFVKQIGSLDADNDKPAIDPVLLALKPSSIVPSEDVWFIGDTVIDVECAINAGCTPFIYGPTDVSNYESYKKINRLNSWQDLLKLLKPLLSL